MRSDSSWGPSASEACPSASTLTYSFHFLWHQPSLTLSFPCPELNRWGFLHPFEKNFTTIWNFHSRRQLFFSLQDEKLGYSQLLMTNNMVAGELQGAYIHTLKKKRQGEGTCLVVQWLRICASAGRSIGLIPGQATHTLHSVAKKKKRCRTVYARN